MRWRTTSWWAEMAENVRMEGISGVVKLKLHVLCTWSLAELEMNLEEIVMKVTTMMENQDLHMMNTRIYLKRKFD